MNFGNETHWTSRSLKKIVVAACKAEGVPHRNFNVEVVFSRQHGSITGLGTYNHYWMRIRIPKPWDMTAPHRMRELAQVVVHEMGHNLGLYHRDMAPLESLDVSWVEGMTLERKVVKMKQKKDKLADRAKRAEATLERHKAVLTKEQRLVAQWERKLRQAKQAVQARERRQTRAAAACSPSEEVVKT